MVVTPTDIIKIRAQLSEENGMKRKKPLVIFKQIYAESGPIGFYRGWTGCAIRDIPGVGMLLLVLVLIPWFRALFRFLQPVSQPCNNRWIGVTSPPAACRWIRRDCLLGCCLSV
jgi:hypothetical protein